ncbi:hypothetical protein TWF281_010359 [Arthrobotrys megalospora]
MAKVSQDSLIIPECSSPTTNLAWGNIRTNVMEIFPKRFRNEADVFIRENKVRSIEEMQRTLVSRFNLQTDDIVLDRTIHRLGSASERILGFSKVVDTLVQADPTHTAIFWGCLKLILMVLVKHRDLLEGIVKTVEEMDKIFPRIEDYTTLFKGHERVQEAAALLLYEYLSFYARSAVLLKKRRARIMVSLIRGAEEKLFRDSIKSIASHKNRLEEEAKVASMKNDAAYQSRGDAFMEMSISHQEKVEAILSTQPVIQVRNEPQLPVHIIPYRRNKRLFFGRQDIIEEAQSHLTFNKNTTRDEQGTGVENGSILSCVFFGLGGIGKTRIALELTYRMKPYCDVIIWVSGSDDLHAISEGFSEACKQLGLDPNNTQDPAIERQRVLKWLEETDKKWLIVFDNAFEYSLLEQYWPTNTKGNGRVLITSRNLEWSLRVTDFEFEVTPMNVEEGVDFLNHWLVGKNKGGLTSSLGGDERRTMEALIKELGGLPLYITHVAGYILQRNCSVAKFSQIYKTHYGEVTSGPAPMSVDCQYNLTWRNVWDLSFKSLSADALYLIHMFAFLAPDNIPQTLFSDFQPTLRNGGLVFDGGNPVKFYDAIQDLSRHSFINQSSLRDTQPPSTPTSANIYAIHREVKRKLLDEMGKDLDQRYKYFQNVLLLVAKAFPRQSDEGETMTHLWPQCDQYASSLLALAAAYSEANPPFRPSQTDESFARLLYDGSWYLWEKRFFREALRLAELAERVIPDKKSLLYSDILTVIAVVNLESSRYHQGLKHFRHAYEVVVAHIEATKNCGKREMIHLANASNNVATGLLAIGSASALDEASEMLEKAGELKRHWASEHKETSLFTEHYCNMGRLKCLQAASYPGIQGQKLMKEAISLSEQAVLLNHNEYKNTNMSRTTSFKDNHAFVLKAAGRHEEASLVHRQNFKLRVKYLGDQVQDTALSYHFLAAEHYEQGGLENLKNALQYLKKAIAILEKSFMAEDRLARSTYLLSQVLQKLSRIARSLSERREAGQEAEDARKASISYYRIVAPDKDFREQDLGHQDFEELLYWWYRYGAFGFRGSNDESPCA